MLSRRTLLLSLPLAACTTTVSIKAFGVDQAITDALSVANSLKNSIPSLTILFPKVIGPNGSVSVATLTNADGTGWLDAAINGLTGLTAASPQAITDLATAEQYINLALNAVASVAQTVALVSPQAAAVVLMVQAAIALSGPVEQLINSLVKPSQTVTASRRFKRLPAAELAKGLPPMTPEAARNILHH